jgi:poly-gamma-glutamate synthesis protein (capsule biosynthesis protein)
VFVVAVWFSNAELVLSQTVDTVSGMTLLLFGDVNLGRNLGQDLLKGQVEYPFARMKSILRSADCVFANLESPITDQNGETESPNSNFIFCAPPVAATVLKQGGVTIVSTANNHAFDYSLRGLCETIQILEQEGIQHVGSSADSVGRVPPVVLRHNGIAVGFLAYTQFVNGAGPWGGRIAVFDSVRARRDIRLLKQKSDLVIVSFHGGKEYVEEPDLRTRRQLESLVNAGADIVVGHHPHVPQGIEVLNGRVIFYSLGNFIFNQSSPWAKRSFGVELKVTKQRDLLGIASIRLIPFRAYKQPATDLARSDIDSLLVRLRKTSNATIVNRNDSLFVSLSQFGHSR